MKKILTILFISFSLFISCDDDEGLSYEEQLALDIEKIEKYLAENNLTAQKTESGLYYIIEKEGVGEKYPNINSTVIVEYTGRLLDGTVFDSGEIEYPLNRLIKGWQEGLQKFKPLGKGKLIIPSGLAYGKNGSGTSVPANAVLEFDILLVNFN